MKKIKSVNSHTGEMDDYYTYLAGMEHKFPGYTLDEKWVGKNISDIYINL